MSQACGTQAMSIVINDHRTKYDFVTTIPVNISNGIVMITLTIPRATRSIIHPSPTLCKLMCFWIYIKSHHFMAGIDTTSKEDAWMAPIQVRSTKEVLATTMTITITPSLFQVSLSCLQAFQRIFPHIIWLTCLTIHIDKILSTCMRKGHCGTTNQITTSIDRSITNSFSGSISHVDYHTIRTTKNALCLAILIPVVSSNVDFITLEIYHVWSTVNPPKQSTIQLIYLDNIKVLAIYRITISSIVGVTEF